MRRQAEPRLQNDEQARLEELGWDSQKPHQPMPIEEAGTAGIKSKDENTLVLGEEAQETVLRVKAPEDLLHVRR